MIGVAFRDSERLWVEEFFELFKTPWEVAVPGKHYRAFLCTDDRVDTIDADLILAYGAGELTVDRRLGAAVEPGLGPVNVEWQNDTFPIYGRLASFSGSVNRGVLTAHARALDYRLVSDTAIFHRIGYDLFTEVSYLLTQGQPRSNAATPTIELHIDFIRQCLRDSDVPHVEVEARPLGRAFVCCLTHDIDFFGIRRHAIDWTVAGFLLRGTVGTLGDVMRGRRPLDEAVRNWLAVLSLPAVWLGLRRDFWHPFADYSQAEPAQRSTFFLIPFKGQAGVAPDGTTRRARAAPYGIRDIEGDIRARSGPAVEFAVHGIDAWRDSESGGAELKELASVTGQQRSGVRMHWLYFSPDSPRQLEEAGFSYDSTWGYNDAVGYRAGTSQVFRLPASNGLMELPMSIMDSALFFRDRMGLDRRAAMDRCRSIVQYARRFGGALVINWHDRSLVPERQWGRCYQDVLKEVTAADAWFATASEAVEWFRWRRTIQFRVDSSELAVRVEAPPRPRDLPCARLTVRRTKGRRSEVEEVAYCGDVQFVNL